MSEHNVEPVQDSSLFTITEQDSILNKAFLLSLEDGQWHRGRQLCAQLDTDERTIRALADASGGAVISSSAGYKLLRAATNDEIDHAEARLISQGRKMIERAAQYRKARNQGGRAA